MDHRQLAAHDFAIINPLQVDRSQWSDLPTIALNPPGLSAKPDTMPRLLPLARLDESRRVAVLIRADAWDRLHDAPFFSLLLKSNANAKRVATHLARQSLVTATDGAPTLLRWYDPRVFRHLRWLLSEAQLGRLSGPVSEWTWRDRAAQWRSHAVHDESGALTRLNLTAAQWTVIGRIGVLNRTIVQLHRNAPEIALDDDALKRIDAYLQQAYGIHAMTDEADARLFAEQAIRCPGIHDRPQLVQRLARARSGEISYVGACADIELDSTSPTERNLQRKDAVT